MGIEVTPDGGAYTSRHDSKGAGFPDQSARAVSRSNVLPMRPSVPEDSRSAMRVQYDHELAAHDNAVAANRAAVAAGQPPPPVPPHPGTYAEFRQTRAPTDAPAGQPRNAPPPPPAQAPQEEATGRLWAARVVFQFRASDEDKARAIASSRGHVEALEEIEETPTERAKTLLAGIGMTADMADQFLSLMKESVRADTD